MSPINVHCMTRTGSFLSDYDRFVELHSHIWEIIVRIIIAIVFHLVYEANKTILAAILCTKVLKRFFFNVNWFARTAAIKANKINRLARRPTCQSSCFCGALRKSIHLNSAGIPGRCVRNSSTRLRCVVTVWAKCFQFLSSCSVVHIQFLALAASKRTLFSISTWSSQIIVAAKHSAMAFNYNFFIAIVFNWIIHFVKHCS